MLLGFLQTWKEEMQYVYAGEATFPEYIDPWSKPYEFHAQWSMTMILLLD